MKVISKWRS